MIVDATLFDTFRNSIATAPPYVRLAVAGFGGSAILRHGPNSDKDAACGIVASVIANWVCDQDRSDHMWSLICEQSWHQAVAVAAETAVAVTLDDETPARWLQLVAIAAEHFAGTPTETITLT